MNNDNNIKVENLSKSYLEDVASDLKRKNIFIINAINMFSEKTKLSLGEAK